MPHNSIKVFTTPTCPDCVILKRWLDAQGVVYVERDLQDPKTAEEARSRTGMRIAPITIIDGTVIWGRAADQIAAFNH